MSRKLIIILDNIRSHHNVGSVFRSADAFGIEELILLGISPCPPHRDIQKTALGATESVPWRHVDSLEPLLSQLRSDGYTICSIEQDARATPLEASTSSGHSKLALILGNELKGVSQELLDASDMIWEIPQVGLKKSLNVSVCAGIVMHHLSR